MTLVLRYATFALLATAVNILAQEITLVAYHGRNALLLAVMVGTAAGLLLKYQLDKRYIFKFTPASIVHDTVAFVRYTVMGVLTTGIFWGFEFFFDWYFETKRMRYTGAVIGLGIGYLLKYNMDKRFVFGPQKN
jgi:putative flippase GtrA